MRIGCNHIIFTILGTSISQGTFEDDVPFPKVGYVSSCSYIVGIQSRFKDFGRHANSVILCLDFVLRALLWCFLDSFFFWRWFAHFAIQQLPNIFTYLRAKRTKVILAIQHLFFLWQHVDIFQPILGVHWDGLTDWPSASTKVGSEWLVGWCSIGLSSHGSNSSSGSNGSRSSEWWRSVRCLEMGNVGWLLLQDDSWFYMFVIFLFFGGEGIIHTGTYMYIVVQSFRMYDFMSLNRDGFSSTDGLAGWISSQHIPTNRVMEFHCLALVPCQKNGLHFIAIRQMDLQDKQRITENPFL